jgi:hypothetical protein
MFVFYPLEPIADPSFEILAKNAITHEGSLIHYYSGLEVEFILLDCILILKLEIRRNTPYIFESLYAIRVATIWSIMGIHGWSPSSNCWAAHLAAQ